MKRGWSRRGFLRWSAGSVLGAALAPMGAKAVALRPNIVFILTDDQRYDAMSCAGHPWVQTPHMDRLAREGARFRNAFVTTSLCSPSRASFLTGCYAHTHGVFTNGSGDLDASRPTFAQILQKTGYETAFIGKWHMGRNDAARPGFDHWVSFAGQGRYFGCPLNVNGQRRRATKYITDELTDHAVAFLKKPRQKPFLLYLSHKAVHAPFTPAKRHAGRYGQAEVKSRHNAADRLTDKVPWGRKMPGNWQKLVRDYTEALLAVDESVGRVVATLAELKQIDQTAIVFAGDNGYFHGEHGGLWDKRAAYEPSMRIPLLMRYPLRVKAGTECDALVLNIDLAPTLLELAGAAAPASMQGRSWMGAAAGSDAGRRSFLYEYFREGDKRFNRPSVTAVRTPRWKYITYPSLETGIEELYDLEADPHELRNLAASPAHATQLEAMKKELARLKKETSFRAPAREPK